MTDYNQDLFNKILSIFLGIFIVFVFNNLFECPRKITVIDN